jgi:hypothetical protein
LFKLRLKATDALSGSTTPDLELRFARPAPTNAAGQAGKSIVALAETRQKIPHLRKLDLQLTVAAFGVLSKDVEDELCAIDDPEVGHPRDVVCLRWPKVAVEDQRFRIELHGADHDVLELSAAKRIPRVHAVANLQHPIGNLDPCCARELFQLSERVFGLAGASFVTHVDQDGTAVFGGDSTQPGRASEFLLERRDDLGGVFAGLRVGSSLSSTTGKLCP